MTSAAGKFLGNRIVNMYKVHTSARLFVSSEFVANAIRCIRVSTQNDALPSEASINIVCVCVCETPANMPHESSIRSSLSIQFIHIIHCNK